MRSTPWRCGRRSELIWALTYVQNKHTLDPAQARPQVSSVSELLALRAGFAVAQGTQTFIYVALTPKLFPHARLTIPPDH